ncbi:hypothetical protein C8R42DRAFT_639198 [Lentinula raphanica]|nr:hypothetical protein C8R42DRAFT_639198 [Lentinula raphanica]
MFFFISPPRFQYSKSPMTGSSIIKFRVGVVVKVLVLMLALLLPTGYAIPVQTPGVDIAPLSNYRPNPGIYVDTMIYYITFTDSPSSGFELPLRYQAEFESDEEAYKSHLKTLPRKEQKAEESKRVKFDKAQKKALSLMRQAVEREHKGELEVQSLASPWHVIAMSSRERGSWYPSYEQPKLWEEVHARVSFRWMKGVRTDQTGQDTVRTTGKLFKSEVWLMTARKISQGVFGPRSVQSEKVIDEGGAVFPVLLPKKA